MSNHVFKCFKLTIVNDQGSTSAGPNPRPNRELLTFFRHSMQNPSSKSQWCATQPKRRCCCHLALTMVVATFQTVATFLVFALQDSFLWQEHGRCVSTSTSHGELHESNHCFVCATKGSFDSLLHPPCNSPTYCLVFHSKCYRPMPRLCSGSALKPSSRSDRSSEAWVGLKCPRSYSLPALKGWYCGWNCAKKHWKLSGLLLRPFNPSVFFNCGLNSQLRWSRQTWPKSFIFLENVMSCQCWSAASQIVSTQLPKEALWHH